MKTITKLWIGLIVLIALSPLGLFLPEHFRAGDAWGEWDGDTIKELIGYVPQGLKKLSALWSAPIPDYAFKGWEEKPFASISFAYIASAIIGILACAGTIFLLGNFLSKKE
jgi:hypothetical protein